MINRKHRLAAAQPRVLSREFVQRIGALLVFAALVFGQSLLQNSHDESSEGVCLSTSPDLQSADHSHAPGESDDCPNKNQHNHDPEKCGICKQLLLAKTLVSGERAPDFVVEFVEVPDGRVIGLVHRAKPELASAPTRGPPATDL